MNWLNRRRVARFIRKHQVLYVVACFVLRRKHKVVYSWEDIEAMVDSWSLQLPFFDAVLGIPRSGLLVADRVALNLGLPLGVPELFPIVWSRRTSSVGELRSVLVVDDSVTKGRELFEAVSLLRGRFPYVRFFTGALVRNGGCPVDYWFVDDVNLLNPSNVSYLDLERL